MKRLRHLPAAVALAAALFLGGAARPAPPRTDLYGDPLPPGAYARLGTVRFRNAAHGVSRLAVSPDGKTLASTGSQYGSPVSLWDAQTGKELRRLRQTYGESLCFSPDGKTLLVSGGSGGKSTLWDVATGKPVRSLPGHLGMFSADGKTAVTVVLKRKGNGFVYDLCLWQVDTGKKLQEVRLPRDVSTLAFAPDNRTVAVYLRPEDWEDEEARKETIHVWDLITGRRMGQLAGHHELVSCMAFAPDGKTLASVDLKNLVRVWDVSAGKILRSRKSAGMIRSLTFSRDGKWLAWVADYGRVQLWDATGKEAPKGIGDAVPGSSESRLAFSPDLKFLYLAGDGGIIRCWDVATGKDACSFAGHNETVHKVEFTPDGRTLITASRDRTIAWDLAAQRERTRFARGVLGIAADRHSVFGASDDKIMFFQDLNNPKSIRQIKLPGPLWDDSTAALSPDGKRLAVSVWTLEEGPVAWLLDARDGKQERRFGRGLVRDLSPDGATLRIWVADGDRGPLFSFFDAGSGQKLFPFWEDRFSEQTAVSPDGRTLAWAADDGRVRLWQFPTRRERAPLYGAQRWVTDVFFSADGRMLGTLDADNRAKGQQIFESSNDRPTVGLWNVATGKRLAHFGKSQAPAYHPKLSPDARTLATVNRDNTVRLWEVVTGRERGRFRLKEGMPLWAEMGEVLAFSPDGRTLAAVSGTAVLLLDVTGRMPDGRWRPARLSPERLQSLWDELAAADAARAYRAMWELTADPDATVPWMRDRLRPVEAFPPKKLARWVANLDDAEYAVRQRASAELTRVGELAEPALRAALARAPSLEARRRIEQILPREQGPAAGPEPLRTLRAVEALEHIGTPAARHILERLAGGAAGARVTEEARAALARLPR